MKSNGLEELVRKKKVKKDCSFAVLLYIEILLVFFIVVSVALNRMRYLQIGNFHVFGTQ